VRGVVVDLRVRLPRESFGVSAVESHISKARCGAPLFLVGKEFRVEQWFARIASQEGF
jgi:hypothetical protein